VSTARDRGGWAPLRWLSGWGAGRRRCARGHWGAGGRGLGESPQRRPGGHRSCPV